MKQALAFLATLLPATTAITQSPRLDRLSMLPKAITSFGAARAGDWIYVYGGHVGRAHAHSRDNLSGSFYRRPIEGNAQWEELPSGPPLQSPSLVAYGGKLYRIGGLDAKNARGEKGDLYSVASVHVFDPATKAWSNMPALPEPRSSHDAFVVGSKIYVVGGWRLNGRDGKPHWYDHTLALDLSSRDAKWTKIAQPFRTRALACAASDGKLVAIGGITKRPNGDVWIFDPDTESWSRGPKWPGFGFATSAATVGRTLFASGLEGIVYRLEEDAWKRTTTLAFPRFFHRLVPSGDDTLVAIAGADSGGHARVVETVHLSRKGPVLTSLELDNPSRAVRAQSLFRARGSLYAFGGSKSAKAHGFAADDFVTETFQLHPASAQWRKLSDLPAPRMVQEAVAHTPGRRGGRAYAIGGLFSLDGKVRSTNETFALDLKDGTWSPTTMAMPEGRMLFGATMHDGRLWVFGGSGIDPERRHAFLFRRSVLVGKPDGELRDTGIATPRARRAFAGAKLGDRYYMVGGFGEKNDFVTEVDVFDFDTKVWSSIPAPPAPRAMADLVVLDGKLYLCGGWSPRPDGAAKDRTPNASVDVFDPSTGKWSTAVAKLPFATQRARCLAWHHRILFFTPGSTPGRCSLHLLDPGAPPIASSRPSTPR